jgi:hypothetical protein
MDIEHNSHLQWLIDHSMLRNAEAAALKYAG